MSEREKRGRENVNSIPCHFSFCDRRILFILLWSHFSGSKNSEKFQELHLSLHSTDIMYIERDNLLVRKFSIKIRKCMIREFMITLISYVKPIDMNRMVFYKESFSIY